MVFPPQDSVHWSHIQRCSLTHMYIHMRVRGNLCGSDVEACLVGYFVFNERTMNVATSACTTESLCHLLIN